MATVRESGMDRSSTLQRKTAYGRTVLFLPTQTSIIREVKCMGGIQRFDKACVFHMLPPAYNQYKIACWHCCEPIEDKSTIIPLPRLYDTAERVYHVYGAACTPSCAKAYIIEHTTYDRGQHLNVLVKMLREVFNVTTTVTSAPPRAALVRFGGVLSTSQQQKATCAIVHPPFVSYCMIAEEKAVDFAPQTNTVQVQNMHVEEADILDEPAPPALYADFVRNMQPTDEKNDDTSDPMQQEPAAPHRLSKRGRAGPKGPLAKFLKSGDTQ